MVEKHKRDAKGRLQDGVRSDAMTAVDRKLYAKAAQEVGTLSVPRMYDSLDPRSHLYVANFDGTGNDLWADPEHATNVGKLHLQLLETSVRNSRVWPDYIKGAGTQDDTISRAIDGATGGSYDERIEWMYLQFITRAKEWIEANPDADIRVIAIGFSRGAEQAAGFVRLVQERGIQDPKGREVIHHEFGPDTIKWNRPPLREPGKTLTAEILFDPVGTGVPNNHDRQPTSSTAFGVQFTARDERRNAFPSTQILRPGLSSDGRFVGIVLPGAHSDIGGSYHSNGLSVLNYNIAADILNSTSDKLLVHRSPVPTDQSMFEIHRSEEHMWLYSTSEFRHDGRRDIMGSQAYPPHCQDERPIILCALPDPFDPDLQSMVGPRYLVGVHDLRDPIHPDHGMYHSASVQLMELHVRSGFGLSFEQADRLTTALVVEAKKNGMKAIDDIQFGKEFDPIHPTIDAFETIHGEPGGLRSNAVSVEALKALDMPVDELNQQLHVFNQEKGVRYERENEVAPLRATTPTLDAPPVAPDRPSDSIVTPAKADGLDRDDDAVRSLQKNLNTLGIRDMAGEPLAAHGVYDVATQTAVARFQSGHALPVTGHADETTRDLIQGQAFIAELQQPGQVRMPRDAHALEVAAPSPAVAAYDAPTKVSTREALPSMMVQRSRNDPRNPDSDDHALYTELQRCLPEASEDRLVQFTAACHRNRITAGNLSEVHMDDDSMTLSIDSDDLLSTPAVVDLSMPPPEPEQSIRQIQQFDQQMEQIVQQSQERSTQMAQQGLAM